MNTGFSIRLQRDDVTKDLQRLMGKVRNAAPLLRAVGVGLVGLTKQTFNDASLRPVAWPAKKDGSKATLKSREATLWRSIRVQSVDSRNVVIGSDRPYAAIHQLGGKSRPMPQRPYFPVYNNQITRAGQTTIADVIEDYLKVRGTRK
jgi:phage gpG-like protein